MTEARLEPWYGGLSYASEAGRAYESLDALIARVEAEGWVFVQVLPGNEMAVSCEHHLPPRALFRRRPEALSLNA